MNYYYIAHRDFAAIGPFVALACKTPQAWSESLTG